MRIDKAALTRTLRYHSAYKRLRISLLPHTDNFSPDDFSDFVNDLHSDIESGRYFPEIPRGYIVADKSHGVTRMIPALGYRDLCVYYYCVKELEPAISIGRIAGTFGGWSLGGAIRVMEESEHKATREAKPKAEPIEAGPYIYYASVDPARWQKQWKEFERIAWTMSERENINCFLKYDIANFFDNINLELLERKLRARVDSSKQAVVDLLFVLLQNWNRQVEGYGSKTVGIPQHEAGDCSRALANFYLQDYDAHMLASSSSVFGGGAFYRYVDDQVVMTTEAADADRLLFEASVQMHKIGLNVNSGKVIRFLTKEDFQYYWAFDIMSLLDDRDDLDSINMAAQAFVERILADAASPRPKPWRARNILNKLLSGGLDKVSEPYRSEIKRILFQERPIATMEAWMMECYFKCATEEERRDFVDLLELWIPSVPFNAYHLNVLRFYQKVLPDRDTSELTLKIEELRYP